MGVYSNSIHNCSKPETTQMFLPVVDEQTKFGIAMQCNIFRNKKEQTFETLSNLDKSQRCYS